MEQWSEGPEMFDLQHPLEGNAGSIKRWDCRDVWVLSGICAVLKRLHFPLFDLP